MASYLGPVTACSWEKEEETGGLLLFGMGCRLYRRAEDDEMLLMETPQLPKGAVIHGIRNGGQLVFGGRYLGHHAGLSHMFAEAVLDARVLRPSAAEAAASTVLLVAFSSGRICRVDAQSGAIERVVMSSSSPLQYLSMRLSPCCSLIAAGSVMGNLHVWDIESSSMEVLLGHKGAVFCQRFNNQNPHQLVTGGEDRTVRLWTRNDNTSSSPFTLEWTATGPTARVWDCDFWSGGVLCVGEDSVVRVWDFTGRLVRELDTGARNVYCVAVYNDIATCAGFNSRLLQFDLAFAVMKEEDTATIAATKRRKHDNLITCLRGADFVNEKWEWNGKVPLTAAVDDGGKRGIVKCMVRLDAVHLLVGTSLGKLLVFDSLTGQAVRELPSEMHRREISVLELDGDGQLLFTASGDGTMCIRRVPSGAVLAQAKIRASPTCAVFLPNHSRLALGDSFGNVFVLANLDGELVFESSFLRAHGLMPVTSLVALGNGMFVSGGRNGTLMEYSQQQQQHDDDRYAITGVRSKLGGITQVELLCVEAGSGLLVAGTRGDNLVVFDVGRNLVLLDTNESIKRPFQLGPSSSTSVDCVSFAGDEGEVEHIRFDAMVASGGRTALTNSNNSSHFKMIWASAFVSDDRYVTVSEDETMRLWTFPHDLVCKVETPQASVRAIAAFSSCSSSSNSDNARDRLVVCGNGGLVQCYSYSASSSFPLQLLAEHRPLDDGQVRMMCCDARRDEVVVGGSDGFVYVFALEEAAAAGVEASVAAESEDAATTGVKRRLPAGNKLKPTLTTHGALRVVQSFGQGKRAILCCKLVSLPASGGLVVLCGETDGSLKAWDVRSGQLLLDVLVQCGGAGLNCMDVDASSHVVVWCGGDDQSVVRVELQGECDGVVRQRQFESMAAAGVTGIRVLDKSSKEEAEEEHVVFASADQRLTRVRWSSPADDVLEIVEQSMVNVGDVAGLAVRGNKAVVVVGLGLESVVQL